MLRLLSFNMDYYWATKGTLVSEVSAVILPFDRYSP